MVTVQLRRNLAGLLHSTGAKKPNKTNKTVVLLQICVKKITKAADCCVLSLEFRSGEICSGGTKFSLKILVPRNIFSENFVPPLKKLFHS